MDRLDPETGEHGSSMVVYDEEKTETRPCGQVEYTMPQT